MRATVGIIVVFACVLAGCGASDSDQVRSKVNQFVTAAAARDYKTICEQVLAPTLVAKLSAAGLSCPLAMKIALGGVQDPTLSIGKVTVKGKQAAVITLSAARNQQASLETIDLIKTSSGWRLESLGSPLSAAKGG